MPVLTGEFVCPGMWSNYTGDAFALLEWCHKTFDPDEHIVNPIFAEASQVLRQTLLDNVDGDATGMSVLDLEALFDRDRLASLWNEAMRRLGYDL